MGEYKRNKFIQEKMSYVAPKEILLNKIEVEEGKKKEVLHYVPITESFRTLLEDSSMIKMLAMKRAKSASIEKVCDLKDGSVYSNNEYFKSNPDAFPGLIYSDGVEIKNPLGAAKGRYKIVQVFFTLSEIDKAQRSQIDRLMLVM